MTHIRRPLIGLLALFATALTLDRYGIGSDGGEAISTAAYVVALGAIAIPFVLTGVRRAPVTRTIVLVIVGYVAITLLFAGGFETVALYVHASETTFIVLAAALAHRLASGLDLIDETLGTVAFGSSGAVPLESPEAATDILTEMARSRRHDRPLVVTVVAPRPASIEVAIERAAEEVQRALRERYVNTRLGRAMSERLRRSDLVFADAASGHFVVVSPETGPDGAGYVVERIREAARLASVEVDAATATFPDTGVSFEALVAAAEQALAGDDAPVVQPSPRLRAVEEGP